MASTTPHTAAGSCHPTELSDIGNRAFCGCEQLQRFTLLDWGDIEQWVQAEHNAFLCATNLKNLIGWNCSPRKDQILMPLTRNSATNIANIMQVHGRLYGATLP